MRARSLPLLVLSAGAAASIGACSGKGGGGSPTPTGSPTPDPTPTVTPPAGAIVEVEPNNPAAGDPLVAIPNPGTTKFFGVCANNLDVDGWRFVAGTAAVSAQITWTEGPSSSDLDLYVYTSNGLISLVDDKVPPGDSPANVTGVLTTSGTVNAIVEVDCYNTVANVAYTGTLSY